MGFFDSLGKQFGGMLGFTGQSSYDFKAEKPYYLPADYLQANEQVARDIQARPDTSSFADALLKQAQDKQLAESQALAASARGNVNPALLQRNIMRQQSETAQSTAQQAGVIRAQEALANRELNDKLALAYRQLGVSALQGEAGLGVQTQGINAGIAAGNTAGANKTWASIFNSAGGAMAGGGGGGGGGTAMAGEPSGSAGMLAYEGGKVPGKAKVDGDSPVNDTVDAKLSPGEIVVPRSHSENADTAKEFIDHLMSDKKSKKKLSFADVLSKHRALEERVKSLEKGKGK